MSQGSERISGSTLLKARMGAGGGFFRRRRGRGQQFGVTAEGYMMMLFGLLVGFAAWHSGTNLLYLLFAILVTVCILHSFLLSLNMHGLGAEEELPELGVVGQAFDVVVRVRNRKRLLGSMGLLVSHRWMDGEGGAGSTFFMRIPPGAAVDQSYGVVAHRRGFLRMERMVISSRYPFGFEQRRRSWRREGAVLIVPRTFPVGRMASQMAAGFGELESAQRGSGTDLYGLREYVQGEPARHVHWRISARVQKLMVAEYTREERRQVMLALDNGSENGSVETAESFERAIVLTASLARHWIDQGYEVGLTTLDGVIAPAVGAGQMTRILKHLALLELRPKAYFDAGREAVHVLFEDGGRRGPERGPLWVDARTFQPADGSGGGQP